MTPLKKNLTRELCKTKAARKKYSVEKQTIVYLDLMCSKFVSLHDLVVDNRMHST